MTKKILSTIIALTMITSYSQTTFASVIEKSQVESMQTADIEQTQALVTLQKGYITTIAGVGSGDNSGDGGPATSAQIDGPSAEAMDSIGNLYICSANFIRKIDTNGIISTVAGNGSYGYNGDGILATTASLGGPCGIAIDKNDNLYICDQGNHRIRKISTTGIITTVAGTDEGGFYNGDGGQATETQLSAPNAVAVDMDGNLYIVDNCNFIRKVDTNGIITTIAGTGSYSGYGGDGGPATEAQFDTPTSLAVDHLGNIFISDSYNSRIRKIDTNGIITTVAGNGAHGYSGDGGQAISAKLYTPLGVAVDYNGNLFISDMSLIRKVDTNGIITTIAGKSQGGYSGDGGLATLAKFNTPSGLAIDKTGNLYICDQDNCRIREIFSIADPTPLTHTVTFIAEGVTIDTKIVNDGETLTDIPEVPKREGYVGVWEPGVFNNITTNLTENAVYTKIEIDKITSIDHISPIIVPNGTAWESVGLPTKVNAAYGSETKRLNVLWTKPSTYGKGKTAGTYTVRGVVDSSGFDVDASLLTDGQLKIRTTVTVKAKDTIDDSDRTTNPIFYIDTEDSDAPVIKFSMNAYSFSIDGKIKAVDAPFIYDNKGDRALAPVRFITEALGYKVNWDGISKVTIAKDAKVVVFEIGSDTIYDNNVAITMDTAPFLQNGKTYIPVRYIADAFGLTVNWNESTQEITLK